MVLKIIIEQNMCRIYNNGGFPWQYLHSHVYYYVERAVCGGVSRSRGAGELSSSCPCATCASCSCRHGHALNPYHCKERTKFLVLSKSKFASRQSLTAN